MNNNKDNLLYVETDFIKMDESQKCWEICKLLNQLNGGKGDNFVLSKYEKFEPLGEYLDVQLGFLLTAVGVEIPANICDYMIDKSEHIKKSFKTYTPLECALTYGPMKVSLQYELFAKILYKTDIDILNKIMIENMGPCLLTQAVGYVMYGGKIEVLELDYILSKTDFDYAKKSHYFYSDSLYDKVLSVIERYELSQSLVITNKSILKKL